MGYVEHHDDELSLVAATNGTAVVAVGCGSGLLQGCHVSQVDKGDADKESQAEPDHEEVLGHLLWRPPAHCHDVGQRPPRHYSHGENADAPDSLPRLLMLEWHLTHSNLSQKF